MKNQQALQMSYAIKISEGWIETETPLTYHAWPTLCNAGNDRLLAVCSGGREKHVCPFGRIYLYESNDGGCRWSAPRILTGGPLDDRDAGLTVAGDGSLLLNWFTSICYLERFSPENTPPHWRKIEQGITADTINRELGFFTMRSTDGGRTWSEKKPAPVNNVHGPALLRDGSLLWIGRNRGQISRGTRFGDQVRAYRSTDHGRTWELEALMPEIPVPGSTYQNWHELHTIQDRTDGVIYTQIRFQPDGMPIEDVGIWQTESGCGKIWNTPHFVCNGHPPHLMQLKDGRLLMSYGCRRLPLGIRCRIGIKKFGHFWWGEELILSDDSESLDVGYPSTVQLDDETLVTLWYEFRSDKGVASLRWMKWKAE